MINDDLVLDVRTPSPAEIGEVGDYDCFALKGYKCESFLKKALERRKQETKDYLMKNFMISDKITIRINDPKKGEKPVYDTFDCVDLAKSKLTNIKSKECMRLYKLYQTKGLGSLLNAIQHLSPIQNI